jgi:hypothetical protein
MLIIEKVDLARECFSDYALNGNVLTIGGVAVDLADEEDDQEVIISFGSCNGRVHRGLMPCCVYVAEVIIPPRKYETVEVTAPPAMTGSEDEAMDEDTETYTETHPLPLDINAVTLRLWPLVDESQNNQIMEGV